jgi:CHAT domain-containing protein/tetratricopeptide (TPR) repeat protein
VSDAVTALAHASALEATSADIHVDLAAALFEAWRTGQHANDLARALDEVERAGAIDPRSAAVLFDRALIFEALGHGSPVRAAWTDYLAADASSQWTTEARDHVTTLDRDAQSVAAFDPARLTDDAALAAIAERSPVALYHFLDAWLEDWARGAVGNPSSGPRVALALRRAQRDAYDADLVDIAVHLGSTKTARGRCLSEALIAMSDSRAAFNSQDFRAAATAAERAAARFAGSGVSPLAARIQKEWALSFDEPRDVAAKAALALVPDAMKHGYFRVAARAWYVVAVDAGAANRLPAALDAYRHALASDDAARDAEHRALVHAQLSVLYGQLGDRDAAWAESRASLRDVDGIPSPRIEYMVWSTAEDRAVKDGLTGLALRLATVTDPIARAWDTPAAAVASASLLARLDASLGLNDAALEAARRARLRLSELTDPATRTQYDANIGEAEARALLATNPQAAVGVAEHLVARVEHADAPTLLAETLLLKGRADSAAGRNSAAEADWSRAAEALEDGRSRIQNQPLNVSRTNDLWDIYEELIRSRADRPLAALDVAERSRSRALLDSLGHDRAITPLAGHALYDWLPGQATVLMYAVLRGELFVWRIGRTGVSLTRHAVTSAHLSDLVDRFVEALRAGRDADDHELASLVLPPDLAATPISLVAVLPDGPLTFLPFAALKNPITGHRLVQDGIPAIEPSLTVMRMVASAPRVPPTPLLIGVDSAQPLFGLPVLHGVPEELRAIAHLYPDATTMTGADTTAARVLADLPSHTVIHFAGHALANEDYPALTQLFVAPEGTRTAIMPADIVALHLAPGTIVVLSTCEGARGHVFRGEGAMSLARPFLAAGASAVLANLWPVDDGAAGAFVVKVYAELRRGQGLSDALAAAQRAAIADGTPSRTWAGWVTLGVHRNR